MRIALFSDIHGNICGLRSVLAHLDESGGADLILALGDFVAGGPGGEEVFDLLLARDVQLIRGNHEDVAVDYDTYLSKIPGRVLEWIQRDADWQRKYLSQPYWDLMASLPLTTEMEFAPGKTLFACHASPYDPWALMCAPKAETADLQAAFGNVQADVIAYGHFHEHHLMMWRGRMLANVASVGFRSDGLSAYTLLESTDSRWVVQQYQVPFDTQEHERLMIERNVPVYAE